MLGESRAKQRRIVDAACARSNRAHAPKGFQQQIAGTMIALEVIGIFPTGI
jgi:hypothetical protein